MAGKDDVLLKLVIQGLDPAEVTRIAQQSGGELAVQMGRHFQKLTELHALMRQNMDAAEKKSVQEQIKEEQRLLSATKKVYDDLERSAKQAANATSNAWRRTMEDLENFTTVAMGALAVWDRITGSAKHFADEIIRVNQVMRSQGGGASAFKISNEVGDISALDIAAARNKAFLQELKLDEAGFTDLAKAASAMGDAMGTDATQGLNTMLDAMATGRVRALAAIGIVVSQKEAYEKYAQALGTTVEALDEDQKKEALQAEILAKTKERVQSLGEAHEDLSDVMEKTLTKSSNRWTAFLTEIGSNKKLGSALAGIMSVGDAIENTLESALGFSGGKKKSRSGYTAQPGDQLPDSLSTFEAMRQADIAAQRSADFADVYGTERFVTTAAEDRAKKRKKGRAKDGRGMGYSLADQMAISGSMGDEGDEFGGMGRAMDAVLAGTDTSGMPYDEGTSGGIDERLKGLLDAHKKGLEATKDKAGGGVFAMMLFGADGPDKLYEDMDEFEKASVNSMGMVAEAAQHMADALGASLAATISGSMGAKKSARDMAHAVLEGLAAQALGKAIFATAEGLFALASGQPQAAGLFFLSAAKYGAVGVGAGLLARGVGQDTAAGNAPGIGSSSGRAGGGGFNSGRSSDSGGGDSGRPIIINVSGAIPGSEAEIGRNIAKLLNAHAREAGGGILERQAA